MSNFFRAERRRSTHSDQLRQQRRNLARRFLMLESLEQRTTMTASCAVPPNATLHITPIPQAATGVTSSPASAVGAATNLSVPAYNSLAGAADTLYLDFNGHSESTWGSYSNADAPVYDIDGDTSSFSATELSNIQKIWAQVAEDYAPFNINVTTVLPSSFANGVGLRVAIGGAGEWLGDQAGGVGYVDSYTNSIVNTVWVFSANLANGNAKFVAEAASHEAGHAFGLDHQSSYVGTSLQYEYNPGTSASAPIMGDSYDATRGLWWRGSSTSSTTIQDDMSIIARSANTFGYRADDYGNTTSTARTLTPNGSSISVSGVITQTTDLDYFAVSSGVGTMSLIVSVPTNNNLDSVLELRSSTGTLLASAAPTNGFGATLTYNVTTAGTFYVVVKSQGNYGDVGQYSLSGTIVPTSITPPTNPPPTNPPASSTLAAPSGVTAIAQSSSSVKVGWNLVSTATQYRVERRVGSGSWQSIGTFGATVNSVLNTGLSAGTSYSFRVFAINASSTSAASSTATATTSAQAYLPLSPSNLTATTSAGRVQLRWTDNSAVESNYVIERRVGSGAFTTLATIGSNSTSYTDTTASPGQSYTYRVKATNSNGSSGYSNQINVTGPSASSIRGQSIDVAAFNTAAIIRYHQELDRLFSQWGR